jgi:N-acetylmuramoyl-L-alanine amidase/FlgD Ig-like domain
LLRFALAAAVAVLALPSAAAAGVRIESRDTVVPAARGAAWDWRTLPPVEAPYRFNMVGLHWRGSGNVFLRTATTGGAWSPWHDAGAEAEDGPDRANAESRAARGWRVGNPVWVGPADRIQLNVAGEVRWLRTFFIASPVAGVARRARVARAEQPKIIRRRAWGADESIVRDKPDYADRLAFSVVHHTAGAQPSSRAQSAAIVRGIHVYHVQGNGWDDIGYNFLVDRFGQIFEGRGGGIRRNVVGAHAQGFNTGSVGVSVLGTFSSTSLPRGARRALVRLLSWRLDVGHVDPTSRLTWISGGNPLYPEGRKVRLRAVSGHRDTGPTTCPGGALYARLPGLARSVRARGKPKIYAPRVTGALGGHVRFRAVVDPARAWLVTVTNSAGATVASGRGRGRRVDWTWDSTLVPAGRYRWVISASNALEATGLLGSGGVPPPAPGQKLKFAFAKSNWSAISPDGDGYRDKTLLSWRTTVRAEVRIALLNSADRRVTWVLPWTVVPAARRAVHWHGAKRTGEPLRDRAYTLRFQARAGSHRVSKDVPVTVDRTLGFVTISPKVFSPNGDGHLDRANAAFTLTRSARVRMKVLLQGADPSRVFTGSLPAGSHKIFWDGTLDGATAPDGSYTVVVSATTELGTRRYRGATRVDTTSPRLSPVLALRTRRGTRVRFTLDEAGSAVVRFGRKRVEVDGTVGLNKVWRRLHVKRVRVRSWDAAGNPSIVRRARVR